MKTAKPTRPTVKKMERKSTNKRFKARYVIIPIVLIAVTVIGVFALKNRENIIAVISVLNTSKDEIKQQKMENDEKISSILDSLTDTRMRELTYEERRKLMLGIIDDDTAVSMIMNNTQDGDASGNAQSKKTGSKSRKDEIIAKMYLLRARYENSIDGLVESGKASYNGMKDKSLSAKADIADSIIAAGSALEGQCDAEMESLLSELEAELVKNGESTGVISEIRGLYASEKRLKKEELLGMYK